MLAVKWIMICILHCFQKCVFFCSEPFWTKKRLNLTSHVAVYTISTIQGMISQSCCYTDILPGGYHTGYVVVYILSCLIFIIQGTISLSWLFIGYYTDKLPGGNHTGHAVVYIWLPSPGYLLAVTLINYLEATILVMPLFTYDFPFLDVYWLLHR